jgi:hypothetical protein
MYHRSTNHNDHNIHNHNIYNHTRALQIAWNDELREDKLGGLDLYTYTRWCFYKTEMRVHS